MSRLRGSFCFSLFFTHKLRFRPLGYCATLVKVNHLSSFFFRFLSLQNSLKLKTSHFQKQETGAPKTLKQLTDYMLDYVGATNISVDRANSAYYNAKNKTMHFYTSGDDFGEMVLMPKV